MRCTWQNWRSLKHFKTQAQAVVENTPADETLDEWWKNWWSKERNEGIGWLAQKLEYRAHRFEYATLSAFVHTSPALTDFYFHEPKNGAGAMLSIATHARWSLWEISILAFTAAWL